MSGQLWYRHNPRDFLDGIVGMTPDLIGAYIVTLDLIYARGGPIPNDARWLSGAMGCSTRAAASLVERLIGIGKLHLNGGLLNNKRARNELETDAKRARNAAETGANGGRTRAENLAKANEINDVAQGSLYQYREEENRVEKKEDSANALSASADAEAVVLEWNGMAKATGLPLVSALNEARRKAIRSRIAEHGSERLTEAIGKIGASQFCTASKWCGFDWLLKPANLIKVLEGNYDGTATRPLAASPGAQPVYRSNPALDRYRALIGELDDATEADEGASCLHNGARLALP